jgi:hypothetical protein
MPGRQRALEASDAAGVHYLRRKKVVQKRKEASILRKLKAIDSPQAETNEKLKFLVASDCRILRYLIHQLAVIGPNVDDMLVELVACSLHRCERFSR